MKKILFSIALLFLLPSSTFAAIAIDNSAFLGSDSSNAAFTTATFTVTNSNPLIVVSITDFPNGGGNAPSSITYNGVNMTMTEAAATQINSVGYVSLWYLLGQSGTHTFTINKTAADIVYVKAASYTGVKQTGQPDAHGAQATTGTTATANITTVANNSWIMSTGGSQVNGVFTSTSANMVLRVSNFEASYYDSNAAITPAGISNAVGTDSTNGASRIGIVAASFSPSSAAVATAPFYWSWDY